MVTRTHTFERRLELPVSRELLFDWHQRPGAFERLAPSWEQLEVVSREGSIRDGDRLHFRLRKGPFHLNWVARHQGFEAPVQFEDVAERSPFASWRHVHAFEDLGPERSALVDRVAFSLPLDRLSWPLAGGAVEATLERMFAQRHTRTANDLRRHQAVRARGPRRVAISGASGLLGAALGAFSSTGGNQVLPLVRRGPDRLDGRGEPEVVRWDPERGTIDRDALEGIDAMVHLAGEPVVGRWTAGKREAILRSRVEGTRLISEALAKLERKPEVLICASGVGFYGDGGDRVLDEDAPAGEGFLVEVTQGWEAATAAAADAGIRVVTLRIGLVMSGHGGALGQLLLPASLGLGGPVGSGRQWQSTIDLDDLLGVVLHAIHDPRLRGPVNAVGPQPTRQIDFARTLGAVLHRPARLPLPAAIVRAIFGQLGDEALLIGQRVRPRKLEETGFRWDFPTLEASLRHQLGALRKPA